MSGFRGKRHSKAMHDPAKLPSSATTALRSAMISEGASMSDFDDLAWIMAQESMGVPGIRNLHNTVSGLFQLTAHSRDTFYPRGQASVGDAAEEARGGIRYIKKTYGSVKAARHFWEKTIGIEHCIRDQAHGSVPAVRWIRRPTRSGRSRPCLRCRRASLRALRQRAGRSSRASWHRFRSPLHARQDRLWRKLYPDGGGRSPEPENRLVPTRHRQLASQSDT